MLKFTVYVKGSLSLVDKEIIYNEKGTVIEFFGYSKKESREMVQRMPYLLNGETFVSCFGGELVRTAN